MAAPIEAHAIWQATVALATGRKVARTKPTTKRWTRERANHRNTTNSPYGYLCLASHLSSWSISFCWSFIIFWAIALSSGDFPCCTSTLAMSTACW